MSPFEFFFTFYGLLLGFSAAELVSGFARLLHMRRAVTFGWLTPMLAAFVALDIATFWNQAWLVFRFAPFNQFLLVLGLVVAAVFFLAATLVFPREPVGGMKLDDHFWAHRRLVLLSVLAANWAIAALFFANGSLTGDLARLALPPLFWFGLALFSGGTLAAALLPGPRAVGAALVVLLGYQTYNVVRAGMALLEAGGWPMIPPAATGN